MFKMKDLFEGVFSGIAGVVEIALSIFLGEHF